jgi:hypothetical protein
MAAVYNAPTAFAVSRPASHQRRAGLARKPRPGIRHVNGRRFVAHVDQLDAGVDRGIEHRHHVVAR